MKKSLFIFVIYLILLIGINVSFTNIHLILADPSNGNTVSSDSGGSSSNNGDKSNKDSSSSECAPKCSHKHHQHGRAVQDVGTLDTIDPSSTQHSSPSKDSNSHSIKKISTTENSVRNTDTPKSTINNANLDTNREKLIDKVSSEQELHSILDKYRNFIDASSQTDSSSSSSFAGENKMIASSDLGSSNVNYLINPQNVLSPQQMIKENYSILMLKFTDVNDNNLNTATNYDIIIKDPVSNNVLLERSGSTTNGADLQVIDENTFTKGEANNPILYPMWINISTINGNIVNEKTNQPIFIKVI
jgi:hypothetical protein